MATLTYSVLDTKLGDRNIAPADALSLLNQSAGPVTVDINSGNVTVTTLTAGNATMSGNLSVTGALTAGNMAAAPVNNGNVAATGTVQGNSTVLTAGLNFLTGATYTLPATITVPIDLFNVSGGSATIFASVGNGTINGGSANGNISMSNATATRVYGRSTGSAYTIPKTPS